jgi:hypothetical protein
MFRVSIDPPQITIWSNHSGMGIFDLDHKRVEPVGEVRRIIHAEFFEGLKKQAGIGTRIKIQLYFFQFTGRIG